MNLKEALFFSSKKIAYTGNSVDNTGYIRVVEEEEEYEPFIRLTFMEDMPFFRTIYRMDVYGSNKGEPHRTCSFYDIDECEAFLKKWRIDVDDNWRCGDE